MRELSTPNASCVRCSMCHIFVCALCGCVARSRGTKPPHDETTTPKRHCVSGLGGCEAVQTGAGCARVVYVASGSRARAGTSPARPPLQPQGGPCRSRARTGAPDGISGGASWASAARQTRLYVTRRTPRSSRTALDVTCEHIADAGEGKRWVKTSFHRRIGEKHTKDGQGLGWQCDECSQERPANRVAAGA